MEYENNPFAPSQIELKEQLTSSDIGEFGHDSSAIVLQKKELASYRVAWMFLALTVYWSGMLLNALSTFSTDIVEDASLGLSLLVVILSVLVTIGLFKLNRLARYAAILFGVLALPVAPLMSMVVFVSLLGRTSDLVFSKTYKQEKVKLQRLPAAAVNVHRMMVFAIVFLLVPLSIFLGFILLMFYSFFYYFNFVLP